MAVRGPASVVSVAQYLRKGGRVVEFRASFRVCVGGGGGGEFASFSMQCGLSMQLMIYKFLHYMHTVQLPKLYEQEYGKSGWGQKAVILLFGESNQHPQDV